MTQDFCLELGLTQDDLIELLLSQGLARKVEKRIGGRVYEALAIDSRILKGFRK